MPSFKINLHLKIGILHCKSFTAKNIGIDKAFYAVFNFINTGIFRK